MPNIIITKTKLRRGSDYQRRQLVFDQGELIHTIDTNRLFVGDGYTVGGRNPFSKNHANLTQINLLTTINAQQWDLCRANNIWYQLTATDYSKLSSWGDVSISVNSDIFGYSTSNVLTIKDNSLSAKYLASGTVLSGLKIDSNILQLDYVPNSFELTSNKLAVRVGGISAREISSTALTSGLIGGNGTQLSVDVSNYFNFFGNKLSLDLQKWVGDGLLLTSGTAPMSTISVSVDNDTVVLNGTTKKVELGTLFGETFFTEWPSLSVDTYGRIRAHESSIWTTLTADDAGTSYSGYPDQINNGATTVNPPTTVACFSAGNVALTLSSAGFIAFQGGINSRTGESIPRFAIPIYIF